MSKSYSAIARRLGRRGGLQRARRLSPQRRAEIARMGAVARADSFRLARAIQANFDYVEAMQQLAPSRPVGTTSVVEGRLPDIRG